MDRQLNKPNIVHTMQYYSVLKRKKILAHARMNFGNYPGTWMNLEEIILGESQLQKDNYYATVLLRCIKSSQIL